MEMMKKMFERMAGEMGEKEKKAWMEQCILLMEGQGKGKDSERDGEEKEETACSPDRNRAAGCCTGMMEQYFSKMRNCFEEKGREEVDGKEKKPERGKCC